MKEGVLHWLFINNDVEYHQIVLLLKYQAQVLQLLHDGQGHQGIERTIALCWEQFHWNAMFQDATKYVEDCPQCQIAKRHNTEPNTIPGVIIANNPMDLLCVDFTKMDPSKDGKENILVLTDTFTKFSKAFVTPNQKEITIVKILVDKWLMCMVFPHVFTAIKGITLTMKSSHIYMPCTELSNQPPCHTIHAEMLQLKD